MLPISPTELAQLLQLSPGPDGKASTVAEDVLVEAVRLLSFSPELGHSPSRNPQSYTEELCSQYFPSYITSLVSSVQTRGILYTQIFDWLMPNSPPSIARFVRVRPEEACQLYRFVAVQLAMKAERSSELLANQDGVHRLIKAIYSFVSLLTVLIRHLPPSAIIPRLPARSIAGVVALASVCKYDPRILNAWGGSSERQCDTAIFMLSRLAVAFDMVQYREDLLETFEGQGTSWGNCEFGRTSFEDLGCVKMEDGEQMMACPRCLAVRYCSREHQRSDWKRHKLVCFEPSW